jgi:hypothetical protein
MRALRPVSFCVAILASGPVARAQDTPRVDLRELPEEDSDLDAVDRSTLRPGERFFGLPVEVSVAGQAEQVGDRQARGVFLLLRLPLSRGGPLVRAQHVEPSPLPAVPRRVRLPARLVRETVRAALRANGLGPEQDRLANLAFRARASAALPELRLRVVRGLDQSLRLQPTDADPYRTQATDGASMSYEARATWRLDRLVFADEEVAVERLRAERASERRKLVHHVLEVLAAWQRARPTANGSAEEQEERDARFTAASATLDGLTDGAWSSLLSATEPDQVVR